MQIIFLIGKTDIGMVTNLAFEDIIACNEPSLKHKIYYQLKIK